MSATRMVPMRDGVRVTPPALCQQWERAPEGGLRATWRLSCRVTSAADAAAHTSTAAVQVARNGQHAQAVSRSGEGAPQRPIHRWIAGGFIAALYLLTAFAGIAIVVRA